MKKKIFFFMNLALMTIASTCPMDASTKASPTKTTQRVNENRPNILFCIMDDATWKHMSAYGCQWVDTPAFDRLAKEGLLFNNAYTPNAKCGPSRSSILTGQNSWQLREAGNHVVNFPAEITTFPEVLRKLGYITAKTGKGWGPGDPGQINGQKRLLIGDSISEHRIKSKAKGISYEDYAENFNTFLDKNPGDQPWFFWYGAREPHRHYEYGTGAKGGRSISEIDKVPPFWPDNEVVRNDMLDYGFEIEHADKHLGRMIESLEKRGLLKNTLIIMTSDNGMPFPRCKAQEYEYSNHMPLAAMWPMGIQSPGREINDMVSFVDFVPTFLEMAGISAKTSGMEPSPGRSLMEIFQSSKEGQVIPERTSVVIGKERHDYSRPNNQGYPIRGIVENGYLYLYNYHIDRWPTGNPEIGYLDCDGSPTKTEILNMNRKGKGRSFWQGSFGKRQQHEELYDISKDPECMNNLIHQEKLGPLKRAMKAKMEKQLKAEEDPRMFGKGEIFNTYGFSVPHGKNYFERFMDGEFKTFKTRWINPSDLETEPME